MRVVIGVVMVRWLTILDSGISTKGGLIHVNGVGSNTIGSCGC